MVKSHLIATLSLFIATTVVLSSMHASQVLGAAALTHDDSKKISHDDAAAKIAKDLHHHSDKTGSQLIKDASDNPYIDSRSLRLARHKKDTIRHRLNHWKQVLEDIALTHHLFI